MRKITVKRNILFKKVRTVGTFEPFSMDGGGGGLASGLGGRLVGWPAGWLVGGVVSWPAGRLAGWQAG